MGKKMDFFEDLSSAYDNYLTNLEVEKKLHQKMNEEIMEAERKIKLSYQEKIEIYEKNCTVLKQELDDYSKMLENYSTFDSQLIGNIISKIVSIVEWEEYSFKKATYETYERVSTPFGGESLVTNKKFLMVVKNKEKQGYYYDYNEQDDEVNRLVRNGEAFVLGTDDYCYNKNITFYTVSEGRPKCLIDFNKFSYVKDFIDLVVEYRFKNNLDKISEKELLNLMHEFILSKRGIIDDNYKKRVSEKIEELNQQLLKEQLRQDEESAEIELENLLKNGVPSRHNDNLFDRLRETVNHNDDFSNAMSQFEISYEGNNHIAKITYDEPIISSENIFISKIGITSSIKDYFDWSDPDPHFQGFCDIDLVDDGLIGIVDISNSQQDLNDIINTSNSNGSLYKIDKISDKYLRVLYLPNNGQYSHRPINSYKFVIDTILGKDDQNEDTRTTSYKREWDSSIEAEKMLTCLQEIELLSNLDAKQLKLYKEKKQ